MTETKYTFCRLCEGICGLEIELANGRVTGIAPDPENPLSRGFICVKGANAADILYDQERVAYPMRRRETGWERAAWDAAFADIGARLTTIKDQSGPDSIAVYLGNPSGMSTVTMYIATAFLRSLGSSRKYSAMTLDNMNKFLVAEEMFGDKSFILQRDWENSRYMLVLGHNPRASIFGQLSTRPRGLDEIRTARAEGGRLVLVDPRRTETTTVADEHLRITPGTDAYFLLALLHTIIADDLYDHAFVDRYCARFDELSSAVTGFTPESVAEVTGIDAPTIRQVAHAFATSEAAFALGNTGVTQQQFASVNEWAIEALNSITGNVDRAGGAFYNPGVVDEPRPKRSIEWDRRSRIRGYPRVLGEYPVATLADEILTPGDGQIRALIVAAGNPVATGADTARLREAFASLDLLVVIDMFKSTTSDYAHWLLPATTFFERKDINIAFTRHTPFPFVQYTDAIVDPIGEAREEWDIFRGLYEALGLPFLDRPAPADGGGTNAYDTEAFFDDFLRARGHVQLADVKSHPHGLKLGERPIGAFRQLLEQRSQRIDLAPESILRTVPRADRIAKSTSADFPILLISRRNLRSLCSWLHQGDESPNELEMNAVDADALGLSPDGAVRVVSRTGEMTTRVRITDAVSPGVVSMQFGIAGSGGAARSGRQETMNVLVDAVDGCDELTGMPTLNGIPVRIERDS